MKCHYCDNLSKFGIGPSVEMEWEATEWRIVEVTNEMALKSMVNKPFQVTRRHLIHPHCVEVTGFKGIRCKYDPDYEGPF